MPGSNAIRAAVDGVLKANSAFDLARMETFYTEDAVCVAPSVPVLRGRENLQKCLDLVMKASHVIAFDIANIEVAKSGDLRIVGPLGK